MANMENDPKAKEILDQEVSLDDLNAVSGGDNGPEDEGCVIQHRRNIYKGGHFPNCAATVGDGSWCGTNDACYNDAVDYQGMHDCSKAWE